MKLTITIDDVTKSRLEEIRDALLSNSLSHVIRLAVAQYYQKFFHQNVSIENFEFPKIDLPGMNERIVKTQMERWQLTAEEYSAIVQKLINDFAASGGTMKNPENLIWKACSRYVYQRDTQKKAAAAAQKTSPADGNGEQPKLRPDGSLPSIYAYQDED